MNSFQKSLSLLVLLFIVLVVLPSTVHGDELVNFQGILEEDGQVAHGAYEFIFSIYTLESGGSPVWEETHSSVQVDSGIYSVNLGATTPFDTLDFRQSEYWMEITVAGETLTPRQRITHSMVTLWAEEAGRADTAGVALNISIAPGSVGNLELADDAVDSTKILDGTVTGGDIKDYTIMENDLGFALGTGDITAVNAGDGLGGGGDSSDVTLYVIPGVGIDTTGDQVSAVLGTTISSSELDNDAVDETKINWGTGTNQVSGTDVPIVGGLTHSASTNVEGALVDLDGAIPEELGDITSVIAGNGLWGGGESGDVTVHVGQGDGIFLYEDAVSVLTADIAGTGLLVSDNNLDVYFGGTGSANMAARSDHTHTGYVDITSNQTIGGNKTFTGTTTMNGITNLNGSSNYANNLNVTGYVHASGEVTGGNASFVNVDCYLLNASSAGWVKTGSPSSSYGAGDIASDDDIYADDDLYVSDHIGAAEIYLNTGNDNAVQANNSSSSYPTVWAGNSSSGTALYGQSSTGRGVYAYSSSSGYSNPTLDTHNNSSGRAFQATSSNPSSANYVGGLWSFNNSGYALYIQGRGVSTYDWLTTLIDGGQVSMLPSVSSPDHSICIAGSSQLNGGRASVQFDDVFSRALSLDQPVKVILTPTDNCNGLYVSSKSNSGFTVGELMDGSSYATFDWMAIGIIKGKEERPPIISENELPKPAESLVEESSPEQK